MKATLEFDLDIPEDREAHKRAVDADEMRWALDDIWDKVFRPNNKHGFSHPNLKETDDEVADNIRYEAIEALIEIYGEVLDDYNLPTRSM